jgi:hypothetical protein
MNVTQNTNKHTDIYNIYRNDTIYNISPATSHAVIVYSRSLAGIYIYVYLYVCTFVYMYVYSYIYKYIYVLTFVYTHKYM